MTTPLVIEQTQTAQYIVEQDNEYSLDTDKSVFITNTSIGTVAYNDRKTDNQIGGTVTITFDIPQDNSLDSNVIINFPALKFSLANAKLGDGSDAVPPADAQAWLTLFNNFEDISFKPFNILNNLNSGVSVTFGADKISETTGLPIIMNELNKYFEKNESEIFNSYNVGRPDTHQIHYKSTDEKHVLSRLGRVTLWNNKDNDSSFSDSSFNDASTTSRRPLFIFPGSSTDSENLGFVVENIQMPIPLTVFSSMVGKNGLYGVRTVSLSFTLKNDAYSCLSIRPNSIATAIDFEKTMTPMIITQHGSEKISAIYKTYAAPPTVLQEIAENKGIVPSYFRPFSDFKSVYSKTKRLPTMSVPANNIYGATPGAEVDFRSNQITLNSIPEKVYLIINKIKRNVTNASPAEIALTPSVSCRVSDLTVKFNGAVTNIRSPEEISKMSARNGCTIDYLKTLYTHGQVVCINVSNDISTGINTPINNKGNYIMEIDCKLKSLTCPPAKSTETASVEELYEITVFTQNTKLLSFENNTFSTKEFFMGAGDVEFAINNISKASKYKRSHRNVIRGGSLPGIFAKIARTAVKNGPDAIKLANKIYRDFQGAGVVGNNLTNVTGGAKTRVKKVGGASRERIENI